MFLLNFLSTLRILAYVVQGKFRSCVRSVFWIQQKMTDEGIHSVCLSCLLHESQLPEDNEDYQNNLSPNSELDIARTRNMCVVNARSHCYIRSILVCLYANTITLKTAELLRAVMDINREIDRQVRSDGQNDGRKV